MPGSEQTTHIAARVCRVMSRAPSRPILYSLPYSDGAFFHLAVPSVSIRPSSSALPLSLSVCVSLPCSLFRSRTFMLLLFAFGSFVLHALPPSIHHFIITSLITRAPSYGGVSLAVNP